MYYTYAESILRTGRRVLGRALCGLLALGGVAGLAQTVTIINGTGSDISIHGASRLSCPSGTTYNWYESNVDIPAGSSSSAWTISSEPGYPSYYIQLTETFSGHALCTGVTLGTGGTWTYTSGGYFTNTVLTLTNSVACVSWTNSTAQWAEPLLVMTSSTGQTYTGDQLGADWISHAVGPFQPVSFCFTNSAAPSGGGAWCGGSAGWEFGDVRQRDASIPPAPDVFGSFTCTAVATTNAMTIPPVTNGIGSAWNYAGTNFVVSAPTNAATSQDINKLVNAVVGEGAQIVAVSAGGGGTGSSVTNALYVTNAVGASASTPLYTTNALGGSASSPLWTTNAQAAASTNVSDAITHTNTAQANIWLGSIETNAVAATTDLNNMNLQMLGNGSNIVGWLPALYTNTLGLSNLAGVFGMESNIYGIASNVFNAGTNLQSLMGTNPSGFASGFLMGTGDLASAQSASVGAVVGMGAETNGYLRDALATVSGSIDGGTSPSSEWGLFPLGWGYSIDLKAIFNLDVLEGVGAGRMSIARSMKIARGGVEGLRDFELANPFNGISGTKAAVRSFILWLLLVSMITQVYHSVCDIITLSLLAPPLGPESVQIEGNTLPGAKRLLEGGKFVLLAAAIIGMFPSVLIAMTSTFLMNTAIPDISTIVTTVSSGGPAAIVNSSSDASNIFWLINQWFPAVEGCLFVINWTACTFLLRINEIQWMLYTKAITA